LQVGAFEVRLSRVGPFEDRPLKIGVTEVRRSRSTSLRGACCSLAQLRSAIGYCFCYRIAARTVNTPDSTTAHQGFRLVFEDRLWPEDRGLGANATAASKAACRRYRPMVCILYHRASRIWPGAPCDRAAAAC